MVKRVNFYIIALFLLFFIPLSANNLCARITTTTLPNGLSVIVEENHTSPVVAIQMWVKAGSADEEPREAGIAHVFEHMLFKGTEKRGIGQIAREVEAAGGYINAFTSFDYTVYHLAVASRYFHKGLDIISDAIQHSTFDPKELKKELEVVLEELRMGEDDPGRKLYKTIFEKAYTVHPYRRPVIGYRETVSSLTRDDMLRFFKKWYVPSNMTLVVVGDVDTEEALRNIREYFKDFTGSPPPERVRPEEPPQDSLRVTIIKRDINQTRLAMAFHIPPVTHEDSYPLDVLSGILAGGVTSRLYKRLKLEKDIVHTISAYAMTPRDGGLFLITATLDAERVEEALKEITAEIESVLQEGVTAEELERVKLAIESDFVYARETMQGRARQLGYYQTVSGSIEFERNYLERIRAVTQKEIRRAVARYFKPENLTVALLLPSRAETPIDEKLISSTILSSFTIKNADTLAEQPAEDIKKVELENGITLIVKEDHSNPTVALYAVFPGGLLFETKKTNGLSNFVAHMLTRGTKDMTRVEIARKIENMAGSLSGFSGRNSTGVSAVFLSRFFDEGLEVFSDVILNPTFPEEEIEKLRRDILASIEREEDYLPGYTFKLLYRELFKKHPYGMPILGEYTTVSTFKRSDIVAQYRKIFVPQRMILSVVGDVDSEHVIEKIRASFSGFKRKAVEPPEHGVVKKPKGRISTGEVKQKEQTHIGIGFVGPSLKDRDRYAMEIIAEALGSQGGRLFVELRDKQSLAYSVSAFIRAGVDTGMFGVYIGCAPEKKKKAIKSILRELKKLRKYGLTAEELERAKRALVGRYEMGLQGVKSQASDMALNELLSLGYDHFKRYPEIIESITEDDIQRAAKRYIDLRRYVISTVGPE